MIKICTGFSPLGRSQYGERFLASFDRHWPGDIELECWVEEMFIMPREAQRSLWDIPGALAFHNRHANSEAVRGEDRQPNWKAKEIAAGYSFRHDAYKFWKQILIPQGSAAGMADGDLLIWLDGDVETTAPISSKVIKRLIGDADVCFLGREPKHSEIGFWCVRLNDKTRAFLARMAEIYTSDEFLSLPEWHSAFIWDTARREFDMIEANLSPGGRGHVWPKSPLAPYTRHDKGKRKPR